MVRAAVGVGVGAACGFAAGFAASYRAVGALPPGAGIDFALVNAVLTAAVTATAGAVVGATGDVLAHLRKALPPRHSGPESDYQDPPRR